MKSNEPIKWTLLAAQYEFGVSRITIKTHLVQIGEAADDDGTYSTRQICAAIYSDLRSERTALTRAQRQKIEMENRLRDGELLEASEVEDAIQHICFAMRQIIMLSQLSMEEKSKMLLDCRRLRDLDMSGPAPIWEDEET